MNSIQNAPSNPAVSSHPPNSAAIADTHERFIPNMAGSELMHAEHAVRYRYACRWTQGKRVLDLACGVGFGTRLMATEGSASHAVGVDLSATAVKYASVHHGDQHARYMVGNATSLPFPAGAFDVVVMFEFIEHVAMQAECIAEAAHVLTPSGQLIISTPNRLQSVGRNPFHIRELSEAEFRLLLNERFTHVELLYQANVVTSFITPYVRVPGARDISTGFATVIGTPFRPDEALFMVAVCSNAPVSTNAVQFDGGVCMTRNDEYASMRLQLEQQARTISIQTGTILGQEKMIARLDAEQRRLQLQPHTASGTPADDSPGIEMLSRAFNQHGSELGKLRSEVSSRMDELSREFSKIRHAIEVAAGGGSDPQAAEKTLRNILEALRGLQS